MSVFNQSRSSIIRLIFLGVFLIIILQLFNLQVLSDNYRQLAYNFTVSSPITMPYSEKSTTPIGVSSTTGTRRPFSTIPSCTTWW